MAAGPAAASEDRARSPIAAGARARSPAAVESTLRATGPADGNPGPQLSWITAADPASTVSAPSASAPVSISCPLTCTT